MAGEGKKMIGRPETAMGDEISKKLKFKSAVFTIIKNEKEFMQDLEILCIKYDVRMITKQITKTMLKFLKGDT